MKCLRPIHYILLFISISNSYAQTEYILDGDVIFDFVVKNDSFYFATQDGMYILYDTNTIHFAKNQVNYLSKNMTTTIELDKSDGVWLGIHQPYGVSPNDSFEVSHVSQLGGMSHLKNGQLMDYDPYHHNFSAMNPNDIYRNKAGNIYVTNIYSLLKYNESSQLFDFVYIDSSRTNAQIAMSGDSIALQFYYGFSFFDGNDWAVFDSSNSDLPAYYVNTVDFDTSGKLLIGHENGISVVENGVYTNYHSFSPYGNDVRSFYVDSLTGTTYASIRNAIYKFTGSSWVLFNQLPPVPAPYYTYISKFMIDSNQIYAITFGFEKNFWKFNGTSWDNIALDDKREIWGWVYETDINENGDIIIFGDRVSYYQSNTGWKFFDIPFSQGPLNLGGVKVSQKRDGTYFLSCSDGIFSFDGDTVIRIDIPASVTQYGIADHVIDFNDDIWMGSYPSKLIKYDGQNWTVYDSSNTNISSFGLIDLEVDSHFVYIKGISPIAIYKFDKIANNVVGSMPIITYPGNMHINGVHLWISSANSIYKLNTITNAVEVFDTTDFYPIKFLGGREIMEDYNGGLWFTSAHGLIKYENNHWSWLNNANSLLPALCIQDLGKSNGNIYYMATEGEGIMKVDCSNISNVQFAMNKQNICLDYEDSVLLTFQGSPPYYFNDSLGFTTSLHIKEAGYHTVFVTDSHFCSTKKIIFIDSAHYPIAILSDTTYGCEYPTTLSTNNNTYHHLWDNGDTLNSIQINQSGLNTVIYTTGCGSLHDSTYLIIEPSPLLPSAFTPNTDGLNDTYHPFIPESFFLESFIVFDKWGKQIYHTANDTQIKWPANNEFVPEGIYAFILRGFDCKNQPVRQSGTIAVLR